MKLRLLKLFSVLCVSLFVCGCGGGGGDGDGSELASKVPTEPSQFIKLDVTTDKVDLNTSADDSAEITVITRDSNNVALSDVGVDLSASAGVLSSSRVTTDSSGRATFEFSPGPEKSNQIVVITASTGSETKTIPIVLSGTKLSLRSNRGSLPSDSSESAELVVEAMDANDNPIANADISLSAPEGFSITANGASGTMVTVTTGLQGTATAELTAFENAADNVITAGGLGTESNVAINVTNSLFRFIDPAENSILPVGETTTLTIEWVDPNGSPKVGEPIDFTTTNGYFGGIPDRTTIPVTTNESGRAEVTFTASHVATPADITATSGNESTTRRLQVAAVNPKQLSLQASPTVLRPSIGDVRSASTITAIVRDSSGQLVSGKTVVFTLIEGPGGGEIITPGTAVTDSTGIATVSFISGGATSAQEGVVIRAVVQPEPGADPSEPLISAKTSLTIGNEATSIVLGTTNVVSDVGDPPLTVGYAIPVSVMVVDINGNPVPNATVDLGAYTMFFYTGFELDPFDEKEGFFECISYVEEDGSNPVRTGRFRNEDLNRNGFLDRNGFPDPREEGIDLNNNGDIDMGEDRHAEGIYSLNGGDINCPSSENETAWWYWGAEGSNADVRMVSDTWEPNDQLDPASVVSIPKTVVTGADGLASFQVKYAKGYGNWADVEITASTQVFGDRSTAKLVIPLKVRHLDLPYPHSPFGR